MCEIKTSNIRAWQNELIKQGYAPTYLKSIKDILKNKKFKKEYKTGTIEEYELVSIKGDIISIRRVGDFVIHLWNPENFFNFEFYVDED